MVYKITMEKVTIYYGIGDGGDGSAFIRWFLTEKSADKWERGQEAWGEFCGGSAETFVGSDIHKQAIKNDKRSSTKTNNR